jgi:hypothetical protein
VHFLAGNYRDGDPFWQIFEICRGLGAGGMAAFPDESQMVLIGSEHHSEIRPFFVSHL